jgi:hypothetical protein
MKAIAIKCPAGKYGLMVKFAGEIYAVAADWRQAADEVWVYSDSEGEWIPTGRQVADYRHSSRAALMDSIRDCIGDDCDDDIDLDSIVARAVRIDGRRCE